jgi:hypothetical protein
MESQKVFTYNANEAQHVCYREYPGTVCQGRTRMQILRACSTQGYDILVNPANAMVGAITETIDGRARVTTYWDTCGRVCRTENVQADSDGHTIISHYEFDESGRLVREYQTLDGVMMRDSQYQYPTELPTERYVERHKGWGTNVYQVFTYIDRL